MQNAVIEFPTRNYARNGFIYYRHYRHFIIYCHLNVKYLNILIAFPLKFVVLNELHNFQIYLYTHTLTLYIYYIACVVASIHHLPISRERQILYVVIRMKNEKKRNENILVSLWCTHERVTDVCVK